MAVSQGDIYDAYLRAAYIEELAQLYYNALCAGQGEEPYFFPPEELQKWEYPSQIKFLTNNRLHRRRRICNEENYQPAR